MKKYRAFTLAEVLVVLAIIAVLAVLVTPMLINTVPNKEMVMFKKAYFLTSRAVNELINDDEFYPDDPTGRTIGFQHTSIVDSGASDREAIYNGTMFTAHYKFCGLFGTKLNLTTQGSLRWLCNGTVPLSRGGNYQTADGIMWSMPTDDEFKHGEETISVDVNGMNPPNCGEEDRNGIERVCDRDEAPDQFKIIVGRDGNIRVPSAVARAYLSSQKTNRRYKEFRDDIEKGRVN